MVARETNAARTGAARRAAFVVVATACALFAGAAQAGCLHTGRLWSCTTVGGPIMQMMCIGTGTVRACQEFSRPDWLFIGRHEVLSQVLADVQLSDAFQRAAARSSQAGGDQRPTTIGALGSMSIPGTSAAPRQHSVQIAPVAQSDPQLSSVTRTATPFEPLATSHFQGVLPLASAPPETTHALTSAAVKQPTH